MATLGCRNISSDLIYGERWRRRRRRRWWWWWWWWYHNAGFKKLKLCCLMWVWNLLHVTIVADRIWRWLLDIYRTCGPSVPTHELLTCFTDGLSVRAKKLLLKRGSCTLDRCQFKRKFLKLAERVVSESQCTDEQIRNQWFTFLLYRRGILHG